MKVLRIIARLNVGGPARHVTWLTQALNDQVWETKLVAGTIPQGEEDMTYFASEHGVKPLIIKEMSRELSPWDILAIWKLYGEMRGFSPDIVHTHTAKAGTVGRIAAFIYRWLTPSTLIGKPRKLKIVHTFHGHVFHSYYGQLKTKIFLFIERTLARFATDRIIVISAQQLKDINKTFLIGRAENFRIVPLGIDIEPYEETAIKVGIREELNIEPDATVIGFVGRLTEIKDVPFLLRSFSLLKAKKAEPFKYKLVIVGDGHLRQELESLTSSLGIIDDVIFAGNRDDVAAIYKGFDIVALTSRNEGTPLSIIEAMASAKPVISTAVGGVVDLISNGNEKVNGYKMCERGILVEPENDVAFSNAIKYLADDASLRLKLGEEGKRFVHHSYSKDRLVNDIKELYLSLFTK